ncbi:cytoplasmic dynein 2 heavy chain 1-like protein [Labeo rohita]|uniref:Cytoplasmic dynein 2 heavy chain 1-like protein n=1 Tax=Labeo rohita TaxID=84645 RepID=A0A498P022_LABRO|nr:cytoplasmic dynein 2 heavy chain 1-like protein [Labeo rohita]RXN11509.1 cytoplasmic dynein 2 heavy chain 1-like protein [Labeo rohita]RXN37545.1 cytoplasmic dynein 2 heavy chain 1-like protein [Labeo rohita]
MDVEVGAEVELVSDVGLSNSFGVLADQPASAHALHDMDLCLATSFPASPAKSPPSKKTKKKTGTTGELTDVLHAIQELSTKQDATFQKLISIENSTDATTKAVENLSLVVQKLVSDVNEHSEKMCRFARDITELQSSDKDVRSRIEQLERYSRRWCLKMHGVAETKNENLHSIVLNILENVAPDLRGKLSDALDVMHRVGRRNQDGGHRSIIVRFSTRSLRDVVWRAAKDNAYLKESHQRISEALIPADVAARAKLWPIVKKAREEGKKASFSGPFAFIDGQKIEAS